MVNDRAAAVVVSTSDPATLDLANRVVEGFASQGVGARLCFAADARIPDLAPADIIVLGAPDTKAVDKGEYGELHRSCAGVSFAGRVLGCFTTDSETVVAALRKMMRDTEIRFFDDAFVGSSRGEQTIDLWCRGLLSALD